ncbi:chorismate--pyruvate lyase family protein [Thiobacillus sp.]
MLAPHGYGVVFGIMRVLPGFAVIATRDDVCRHAGLQCGWLPHPFRAPRVLRGWLSDRGSLTQRLRSRYHDFGVVPVLRGFAAPFPDESRALGLTPGASAYVRDVLLLGDGKARVFAHSVLPRAALRGGWNGITRLGTRPLGEALFRTPGVRRLAMTMRRVDARHPLYHGACRHADVTDRELWARRSVFCLDGHALLVSEVFLPAILAP